MDNNKKHLVGSLEPGSLSERDGIFENTEWEDSNSDFLSDDLSIVTDAIYSVLLDPLPDELRNQYWRDGAHSVLAFQLSQLARRRS